MPQAFPQALYAASLICHTATKKEKEKEKEVSTMETCSKDIVVSVTLTSCVHLTKIVKENCLQLL